MQRFRAGHVGLCGLFLEWRVRHFLSKTAFLQMEELNSYFQYIFSCLSHYYVAPLQPYCQWHEWKLTSLHALRYIWGFNHILLAVIMWWCSASCQCVIALCQEDSADCCTFFTFLHLQEGASPTSYSKHGCFCEFWPFVKFSSIKIFPLGINVNISCFCFSKYYVDTKLLTSR